MPENSDIQAEKLESALSNEAKTVRPKLNYTPHGPSTEQDLALYNKAVFEWTTPEYIQHPKGATWYLIAGIIVAASTGLALLTQNWTMALAIVVFAVVYRYTHAYHPPKEIKIVISEMGIKVGDMVFPYTHVQAFWLIYNPPFVKTLNLRVDRRFYSDIVIQLNDEDPVPIRQYLCTQVPEWEGKNERFSDTLLRLLKL